MVILNFCCCRRDFPDQMQQLLLNWKMEKAIFFDQLDAIRKRNQMSQAPMHHPIRQSIGKLKR